MQLQKAIVRFDGLFNKDLIDRIINYIDTEHLRYLPTLGKTDARKVKGITAVNPDNFVNVGNQEMSKLIFFNYIKQQLKIPMLNYTVRFRECAFDDFIQTDFLKYEVGGKYETHADDHPKATRRVTIIINLNEGYEGGDFVFFDPINQRDIIHKETLKKGSILIFPSNFLYPHSIQPITKGTRYSLVTWAA